MTTKAELRVTALQLASGLGLPADLTLSAARKYLAFLEGAEVAWTENDWIVRNVNKAMLATHKPKASAKKAPAKTRK